MIPLYKLQDQYQELWDSVPDDGEIPEELAQQLDILHDSIEGKISQVAASYKNYKAEEQMLAAEIQALQQRKARAASKADWVKSYLLSVMTNMGIKKVTYGPHVVGVQNNPVSVLVEEEDLIPQAYWKPQDPVLDKVKLAADLKANVSVPGATLKQGQHVRIN